MKPARSSFGNPIHLDSLNSNILSTFDIIFDHSKGTNALIHSFVKNFDSTSQIRSDDVRDIETALNIISNETQPAVSKLLSHFESINKDIDMSCKLAQPLATGSNMRWLQLKESHQEHINNLATKRVEYAKMIHNNKKSLDTLHEQHRQALYLSYNKMYLENERKKVSSNSSNTDASTEKVEEISSTKPNDEANKANDISKTVSKPKTQTVVDSETPPPTNPLQSSKPLIS